jgi:hypothetical protein
MPQARIVRVEDSTHDFIMCSDRTVAEVERFLEEIG